MGFNRVLWDEIGTYEKGPISFWWLLTGEKMAAYLKIFITFAV